MPLYALGADVPQMPEDGRYWIAPDAHVIGRVTLGDEVGVWFGAVLRADNEPIRIGAGSNIQEGAVIHVDPGYPVSIGQGCTIGHRAIVHGCTIGDNTLIGMGATILNGAVIGKNCLVGANALVTEGKVFPDNSLIVGAPARAIRLLDDKAVAGLKASANHYVANWRQFSSGLSRID
ncbi:gamma carbonic anhydrase family protein [Pararhizobium antarcticum]|uniref:Gamma carbonic anhydrase family protein n=1 Tax=Pararhizobium antarcticum TaxID=1798805 RepID=A0A657LLB0_9HYPH|nr:gamma carbonic anhydrase family protein [Pararhizobium antarcticum]OJF90725.1 gamma carbonic anhydrase family protein [Pararhizobium antarcticum]OJF93572.1 gamma carbonic anhydrase family protein [Rhizobium sp. 58]